MNGSNRSDDFLRKTYDHLKDRVLPDTLKNKRDFPPADAWLQIIAAIESSIENISQELKKRK